MAEMRGRDIEAHISTNAEYPWANYQQADRPMMRRGVAAFFGYSAAMSRKIWQRSGLAGRGGKRGTRLRAPPRCTLASRIPPCRRPV